MADFERLGLFYLGRGYDLDAGRATGDPVLYDARDLVTHAVCVGMTGSGKTGLGIGLIEEAAIDGVPVIAIDPKGDLGNLLLTFPALAGSDFRPWIDEDEARRRQLSAESFADEQAARWRQGLAEWGQGAERIQRLREAAEFGLYTPGSTAGRPLSILESFAAPPPAVLGDPEQLADRLNATVASLLTLAGLDAGPERSREHLLLASIVETAWHGGRALDLAGMVHEVQSPAVARVGVMDLESFYPAKERFELALRINHLLAVPGFDLWLRGDPLDVDRLLYAPDGRPRVSIVSLAHLGDAERMSVVSLLLSHVVGWMRGRPGSSSLRAVVYMDEVFGYLPPVANPPSKHPLLTLLKQARAYGVGLVLATQNPVDLDYKGLSNAGTWFLGRLQTERDKARVLDGLEGAAAGAGGPFDRAALDRLLSRLTSRVFLLHNVHDAAPQVFQTRWTLSYLRGPLTREQIRRLVPQPEPTAAPAPVQSAVEAPAPSVPSHDGAPVLPPGIHQFFVAGPAGRQELVYEPMWFGAGQVGFTDRKLGIALTRDVSVLAPIGDAAVALGWDAAVAIDLQPEQLETEPAPGARFQALPRAAAQARNYARWEREFGRWLLQTQTIELWKGRELGLVSNPGESERDFRIRLQETRRERRDADIARLRAKYAARVERLEARIRRAEAIVARETEQAGQQKLQTAVSLGATVLNAILGRRAVSAGTLGRATTAARGVGRSMKETRDVERARAGLADARHALAELERRIEQEVDEMAAEAGPIALERLTVRPARSLLTVRITGLVWRPRAE